MEGLLSRTDYGRIRKSILTRQAEQLQALDCLGGFEWRIGGETPIVSISTQEQISKATRPQQVDLLIPVVRNMTGNFGAFDVECVLKRKGEAFSRKRISFVLAKLAREGKLGIVSQGRGGRPSVYSSRINGTA